MYLFISYAFEDEPHARGLVNTLNRFSIQSFSFRHVNIVPGTNFEQVLFHSIQSSHFFALLWGKQCANSSWVRHEISLARKFNKYIVPILLDSQTELPPSLARTQAILAYNDPSGWALQVADALHHVWQYWHQQHQNQQLLASSQQNSTTAARSNTKKASESTFSKIATGVVSAGVLALIFNALND